MIIEALDRLKPQMHPFGMRQGHPLTTGVIFYLPCWDTGKTATDVSGYGHHATLAGGGTGAIWQIGSSGREIYFPGTNDYCSIPHSDRFILDDFTVGLIVDPDNVDSHQKYMWHYDAGSGDGFNVFSLTTGTGVHRFAVWIGDVFAGISSDAGVALSIPQVVVARRVSGVMHIFVNGVRQAATDTNAGQIDSSSLMWLGVTSGLQNDYAGAISLAALWGIGLLDSQIAEFSADPFALIRPPRTMLITWGAQTGASFLPNMMRYYKNRRAS